MKKVLLLLANIAVALTALAQAPTVQWAKSMGSNSETMKDVGRDIAVDDLGNIYSTGFFSGTADFNPGTEVYNLVSTGNFDVFVSKLDSLGNFLWAKSINGANGAYGISIALDAKNNVYSTGYFSGMSGEANTPFISKLDTDGNFMFTKYLSNIPSSIPNYPYPSCSPSAMAIDISGNLYVTGSFSGRYDFDPGNTIYTLISTEAADGFVLKLDKNGNFIWAKQFVSSTGSPYSNNNGCFDIKVDIQGRIYLTGSFKGEVDFDPDLGKKILNSHNKTQGNYNDMFIVTLDASGNLVWVKNYGGDWRNTSAGGSSIDIDDSGNIFVTGGFMGRVNFDPSDTKFILSSIKTSNGDSTSLSAIFVSRLDKDGNFLWAKSLHGYSSLDNTQGASLTVSSDRGIYIAGSIQGTFDFDPGESTYNLTSRTRAFDGTFFIGNPFVFKLDNYGNFVWATIMNDSSNADCYSIKLDKMDNFYMVGAFVDKLFVGSTELTSFGNSDIYVAKLRDPIFLNINEYKYNNEVFINLFPNPSNGVFNVHVPNSIVNAIIEVYNSFGNLICSQTLQIGINTVSITDQPNGIFLGKTIYEGKTLFTQEIIKQ